MSVQLSSGHGQSKTAVPYRPTIAAGTRQYLIVAVVVAGAFRISQAQDRMPDLLRNAEAQLEDGRATLNNRNVIARKMRSPMR